MAEIAPFRGILFTARAGDPAKLLAPPYDVIDEAGRAALERLDPHNVVRLILPRPVDGEAEDSKYEHAARTYRDWLDHGVLGRDVAPTIYRYHQGFRAVVQGVERDVVRKGFIARVRLRRFDEGVILPHERTLSGPKLDRLKLMRAVGAHEFSQVFGLYPDAAREGDRLFDAVEQKTPEIEARTSDGVLQRVWRLTDAAAIGALVRFMAERKVYIADGHHRYETMLALRDELRPRAGVLGPRSSCEFGSMFFCNMDDPGLVVFPTHRVLHGLAGFDRAELLGRAASWFTVREVDRGDGRALRQELAAEAELGVAFGIATSDETVALLRLRADVDLDAAAALPKAPELRALDVTVLHALLFETLLGIDRAAQERQTNLRYLKDWDQALGASTEAGVQAVFLMNPTKVAQVKAVADVGEVMPQKSTFFYPKIASGLVCNPVDPAEPVDEG